MTKQLRIATMTAVAIELNSNEVVKAIGVKSENKKPVIVTDKDMYEYKDIKKAYNENNLEDVYNSNDMYKNMVDAKLVEINAQASMQSKERLKNALKDCLNDYMIAGMTGTDTKPILEKADNTSSEVLEMLNPEELDKQELEKLRELAENVDLPKTKAALDKLLDNDSSDNSLRDGFIKEVLETKDIDALMLALVFAPEKDQPELLKALKQLQNQSNAVLK